MASETYEFLKNIYDGEEVSRWNYPDKLIYDIRPARYPQSTQVIIAFDSDDDFLDVLGIENSDDKWTWGRFMGRGYYGDEVDTERWRYDWEEGYIIEGFNEEQKEKVREILKLTNPKLTLTNENTSIVAKFLMNTFENEVDDIIYEYSYESEQCIRREVIEILEKETKNPFLKHGIVEEQHAYKFKTTVGILLNWYKTLKAENEDLKGLLKVLVERYQKNADRGGWYELEYSSWCNDFDKESLSKSYDNNLDKMLEAAEETLENNPDYEEYIALLGRVTELGGFDKWINVQNGNRIKFHDIDRDTNTLRIIYSKKGEWKGQMRSVKNVEDLNTMIYNLELFESIRKILRKLL
jgi:hypothetical protein